jgi:hypothetical protein
MRKMLCAAAAAALLLGACGGDDAAEDPKGSLTSALDQLQEYDGVTMTMSLDSTTDSLVALSEGDLSDEQAQQIIDSSLTISSRQGEDPADGEAEVTANIAGTENAFEMKVVDLVLYARADVASIMETFNQDPAQLDSFEQQASGQPGFEWVSSALDGEWIALKGFDQLAEQMGGGAATQPTEAQKQAIEGFTRSLRESSEVTAGEKEGPGTHLEVTVPLRDFYESYLELANEFAAAQTAQLPPAGEVPDEDLRLDAWVDDDRLTQIELDVTQFADYEGAEDFPEGVEDLALRVTLDEFTDSVEPPDDAVDVDLSTIMQSVLGAGGGSATSPQPVPGGDAFCEELEKQIEGQPQEVVDQIVDQFGAQCPDLGK